MKTYFNKTPFKLVLGVSLVALFISSCGKNDNNNPAPIEGDTQIKVVNAVEGSNAQDFYQNDTKLTATPVAYGESSANFNMRAGNSTVTFKNATSGTVSATGIAGVYPNTSYIVFYTANGTGSGEIRAYKSDNTVATGKIKLRFVNLGITLTNSVNVVTAGGLALFNGLSYPNSTDYTTIDANTDIKVNVVGSGTITTIPGTALEAGKIYTVWLNATSTTTVQYHIVQQ